VRAGSGVPVRPEREALVQGLKISRILISVAHVVVQPMHRVLHLGQRAFKRFNTADELRFDMGLGLQRCQRAMDEARRIRVVVVQRVDGGLGRFHQRLRVRESTVLCVELAPLADLWRELVEFGDLPRQAFAFLLQRSLLLDGCIQRLAALAPLGPGSGGGRGVNAGVGIKQLAHCVGPGKALPRMLTMNVDQTIGQCLELSHRGRAAVDPRAAATIGVHRAAQQQAVLDGETLLFEPWPQRGRRVEFGRDVAACCAFAHHTALSPGTQGELQRVDQDGLAGAGFAGEHAEAALQFQVQRLHDDKILKDDASKAHRVMLPRSSAAFCARCRNSSSPMGGAGAVRARSGAPRFGRRAAGW